MADENQAGATGDAGTQEGENQGKGGIELTQDKLDELINRAHARGASKAEKAKEAELKELRDKLAKFESADNKGKDKDEATKAAEREEFQRVLKSKEDEYGAKLREAQERADKLLAKDRAAALSKAAAKAGVMPDAIDDVAMLAAAAIGHDDDGNIIVLGANGTPRLGSKGDPMTVEEYLAEWVKARPHFLASTAKPGAGSDARINNGGGIDPKKLSGAEKIALGLKASR